MDVETSAPSAPSLGQQAPRWYHKLSSLLFAIFCFELGVFLIVFPWMDGWDMNYFAWIAPETASTAWISEYWRTIWTSTHFRGAVSGLGFVNIYISILEAMRLRRFSPQTE
jgi:hypothetical protein